MSAYIKYRKLQCPKCLWNNQEFQKCNYGQNYISEGTKFRGETKRLCPHAEITRDIAFEAGERKVARWVETHKLYAGNVSIPAKTWQEFLKSEGIE